ncbi:type II toxin-antitoxin system VapC family toxin [Flavobacterium sp. PLA-1-15]|uniref:type II toxin-antitoxin system VapC family toxin n=1 Tax=Flavobacterium sp. PLA-1-15 TaxID=3380533 RepID=UPI003B777FC2
MIRLFLDTNVMLDLLCERKPYYDSVAKIIMLKENDEIQLAVSSLSFATCHYVMSKITDKKSVSEVLKKFRIVCEVADVDESNIDKSLFSKFNDFEDAVQYYSALKSKSDIIITRSAKDFSLSEIPVLSAEEFLSSINKK